MNTVARKTYKLGNIIYVLPLRATGIYVSDSRGNVVVECQHADAAKQLVQLLNTAVNNS
jgi:hypothetical protein